MRTLIPKIILIFIVSVFILNTAYSQPPKKAMERIEQLKKIKLLDLLDLDEEASGKFLIKYHHLEKQLKARREALEQAMKDLKKGFKKDLKNKDLIKQTEKIIKLHEEMHKANMDKLKKMKSILDDEKYIQYFLFESDFHKELRKKLIQHGRRERRESLRGR